MLLRSRSWLKIGLKWEKNHLDFTHFENSVQFLSFWMESSFFYIRNIWETNTEWIYWKADSGWNLKGLRLLSISLHFLSCYVVQDVLKPSPTQLCAIPIFTKVELPFPEIKIWRRIILTNVIPDIFFVIEEVNRWSLYSVVLVFRDVIKDRLYEGISI